MKKFLSIFSVLSIVVFTGCIKNDPVIFDSNRIVEIDQTTWNANAAGLTYPILTRRPAAGRPVGTAAPSGPDSTLRRYSGTIQVRVNLVGPQSTKEETVGFTVFDSPITTVAFPTSLTVQQAPTAVQTPASPAATLPVTNAVAGTHYNIVGNATTITIPANSSFGFLNIQILAPAAATEGRFFGIQLNDKGSLKASVNYSQIGFVIDQR